MRESAKVGSFFLWMGEWGEEDFRWQMPLQKPISIPPTIYPFVRKAAWIRD